MALRRMEIEAQAVSWSTPFARLPIGAYDMVALQSVRDVWDQARAMHHCVDDFADRCAAGDALIVSVRSADEGGRRMATALYERHGQRWTLAQVRGVANRCPSLEVEAAATFLGGVLNAPGHWSPEAKVKPPVEVGVPPPAHAPRCMPPNARLLADVAWYWSPMHSNRLRYYISGTRDRSSWLLWERYYDDNHGRWAAAKVIAWSPRQGVREVHAAKAMLAACWQRDIADRSLERYHERPARLRPPGADRSRGDRPRAVARGRGAAAEGRLRFDPDGSLTVGDVVVRVPRAPLRFEVYDTRLRAVAIKLSDVAR